MELPQEVVRTNIAELEQRIHAIDAEFIEMSAPGTDSLDEANRLLEMLRGDKLLPEAADRNRLTLKPSHETFAYSGKIVLSPNPMRWLFIGDSITHGAMHTYGYDSLPQLWEKYIRENGGRKDDTVLNTGVSGATVGEYLARLDARYTPYADADVVVAMFGTNDCCFPDHISVGQFKEQMRSIVDMARSHGSQVVLRTPQPQKEEAVIRARALVPFAQAVREIALEKNTILVDHFHSFSILKQDYPEHFLALMSDAVHPNAQGQYRMFRELAYATDLVFADSMATMDYAF